MQILLLSDVESEYLWDHFEKEKLDGIDLILACGDLKAEYLSFLATFTAAPVLYVRGNHDGRYAKAPPGGCECIEDQIVSYKGVRIMGLGGSYRYRPNEQNMYTEKEMARRIRKRALALWRAKGVDILVTHAPAHGVGDAEDLAHRGFDCFLSFMDKYHPSYLIHGHVHANYSHRFTRERAYGDTKVINAYERYLITVPEPRPEQDRLVWITRRKEEEDDEFTKLF